MGRDGWIGLGLLAFSGWLYANLDKIPANPLVPIGPAFYPRFLLILTFLLSLALILRDVSAHLKEAKKEKGAYTNWLKTYQSTLLSFAVFGLYVILLPKLGYLLSTILFVSSLQWLLGKPLWRRLPGSLFIGIGTSVITYMIFEKYLHVLLPRGTWIP
ncbi:MAG: tripartite tricarboxylate transporter TctB family protein [Deltaproteobacteria bacterium]|nr:tripartite tricarboxylate transporter TctB family protein [Deltaproteobacteria bacterium]